jgi:outer membrane protein assembly factor BamB
MRKRYRETPFVVFVFVAVLLLVTPLVMLEPNLRVNAESGTSDAWPMFHHDTQNTGHSTSAAPSTSEVKWFYNTSMEIDSSPAVADGRIIVGVSDGTILALNSTTGEKLWLYDTGAGSNSIWGGPAIDSGKVYIGTGDHNLYCLNEATGEVLWTYLAGDEIASSPLVSGNKVYFGAKDGKLYCLDATDGTLAWSYTTNGAINSSPALADGVVFVCSFDAKVYAIDASSGTLIWDFPTQEATDSSPAVSNGRVFVSSSDTRLYCLMANSGIMVWNATIGGMMFFRSSPAVADNKVFIGTDLGTFYCFNALTGETNWATNVSASSWSSSAVADGKVFFGTEDGRFYCLDENTGAQIWNYHALERVASSPAISDGTVYVGCGSAWQKVGGMYAFGEKQSLPTSLTLSLNSETSLLGFKVVLSGALLGDGNPLEGASIVLSYSVSGGATWNDITSVPTSADGSYSAVWQPSATGTYLVRAIWTPYYPYEKGESERMLSVNTFDEQTVFSVVSNSTLSALAFNSTSKELSFTVTGESGTTGFVDLTVAKSLIDNIADLSVHLDGASINYDATSTTDAWLLHFTYTHSTHNIAVNLGAAENPQEPSQILTFPMWVIAVAISAVVVLIGLVVVLLRKNSRLRSQVATSSSQKSD